MCGVRCVVWCGVACQVLMLLGWVLVIGGWYAWVVMHAVSTLTERGVQKSSQSPISCRLIARPLCPLLRSWLHLGESRRTRTVNCVMFVL